MLFQNRRVPIRQDSRTEKKRKTYKMVNKVRKMTNPFPQGLEVEYGIIITTCIGLPLAKSPRTPAACPNDVPRREYDET